MRLSVAIALTIVSVSAFPQEFTPAGFGDHDLSPINTVRVPFDRPPGGYDVGLTCQVIVETDGSASSPHCLVDERYYSFQSEVVRAVSGAVMEPATTDGQPVRVLMSFMVGYRCLEACSVLFIPNHARHVREYGFEYTAPQPILADDRWYDGFDEKLAWVDSGMQAAEVNGVRYTINTLVDTEGRSSRRRVSSRSSDYWSAATRAARSLGDVNYIPAFYEGRAIDLTLYEYWLDPNARPEETITLPVRVHLLSSIFVDSIDTTLTDAEVRRFLADVNAHWRPAAIEWEVESIVRIEAERELGYRRIVQSEFGIADWELERILSAVCPEEQRLDGGWNVCVVHEYPYVATYLGNGVIIVGERDFRQERVQPFALARELGASLGMSNTPACTARFLGGVESTDDAVAGTCATTLMTEDQITASRRYASDGVPYEPNRLGPAFWSR